MIYYKGIKTVAGRLVVIIKHNGKLYNKAVRFNENGDLYILVDGNKRYVNSRGFTRSRSETVGRKKSWYKRIRDSILILLPDIKELTQ